MNSTQAPYTILAILQAKPGKEIELREILTSLVEPTLQEEGCIDYCLHESFETPGKFMFYENWMSKQAHAEHRETPHIKAWHARKSELLVESTVSAWNIIEN